MSFVSQDSQCSPRSSLGEHLLLPVESVIECFVTQLYCTTERKHSNVQISHSSCCFLYELYSFAAQGSYSFSGVSVFGYNCTSYHYTFLSSQFCVTLIIYKTKFNKDSSTRRDCTIFCPLCVYPRSIS